MSAISTIEESREVQTMQRNRRYLAEYMQALENLGEGQLLQVVLNENEKKNTHRKRWAHAAEMVNVSIKFHRSEPDLLIISVQPPEPIVDIHEELKKVEEAKNARKRTKA